MNDIAVTVGKQVRILRRLNHMTQNELAQHLNRSKTTISKYEQGDIVMDIETLCRLAEIFHVQPNQLLPMPEILEEDASMPVKGIFQKYDVLYGYSPNGTRKHKLNRDLIELMPDRQNAVMYCCVNERFERESALVIYRGTVEYTDIYTRLNLINQTNPVDYTHIHIADDMFGSRNVFALVTSIVTGSLEPFAMRMLICSKPQPNEEDILSQLQMSKDDLVAIRRENAMILHHRPVL